MDCGWRLQDACRLEMDMSPADLIEESGPTPEQHGDEVNGNFVDEAFPKELLCRLSASHHDHYLVAGCRGRPFQGALDFRR